MWTTYIGFFAHRIFQLCWIFPDFPLEFSNSTFTIFENIYLFVSPSCYIYIYQYEQKYNTKISSLEFHNVRKDDTGTQNETVFIVEQLQVIWLAGWFTKCPLQLTQYMHTESCDIILNWSMWSMYRLGGLICQCIGDIVQACKPHAHTPTPLSDATNWRH